MPDETLWPPPGGRHRASGLNGPTRRYALIVLALAVTSSLPILAAIGPGAGSVGDALAVDQQPDTTPFIPPPSPGPVVVIPILPSLAEPPVPPPVATLSTPADKPRRPQARPQRDGRTKPHRAVAARPTRERQPERAKVREPRPRAGHGRVVVKRKLWRHTPAALRHRCRHR
ncbi:hypothetical protein AB0J74_37405 [Asanoa sp. NPDC049573]|uniref:hypothetical protein n=1 Tax=Asanoa sp. NPDC049573 TaxID=3155396 RepID=UPI00341E39DC